MRLVLSDIADMIGGEFTGPDALATGLSIDSRLVRRGDLFVPIIAERDGHDFTEDAISRGAAGYLSSRPMDLPLPDSHHVGAVIVDDTVAAMSRLAGAIRRDFAGPVVGITGSVGKTSTKDLLAAVLGDVLVTHASHRSFNNELGVPVTICNAPDGVEAVVVEMGARGQGHIAALCRIATPTIGVITAVGAAHTELFGTIADVVRAKGELIEALPAHGVAVLRADDPAILSMRDRTDARVVTFGPGGHVHATAVRLEAGLHARFDLHLPDGTAEVALGVAGAHMVSNALAAAAAASAIGLSVEQIAHSLGGGSLSPWRMATGRTATGALVINDAYNANPLSMHAAIDSLIAAPGRHRTAILGEMAELGAQSALLHREIGQRLLDAGVRVIAVGTHAYGGLVVADAIDAADVVFSDLGQDDVVLIKASRVAGLERVAERLLAGNGPSEGGRRDTHPVRE